jgi:hypothetical protein
VRIHTDEPADRAARSLKADAFSLGKDIFFRARRFNPATPKGLALLGHELAHTRQAIGKGPLPPPVGREGLEQEAERTEASLLRTFSPDTGHGNEQHSVPPMRGGGPPYAPLSLEPARPLRAQPTGDGSVRNNRERSTSFSALPGSERNAHPLKAEEGRAAAPASGSGASSSAEDPESLTRHVFRSLERKIRIEKERRGVDRWVH